MQTASDAKVSTETVPFESAGVSHFSRHALCRARVRLASVVCYAAPLRPSRRICAVAYLPMMTIPVPPQVLSLLEPLSFKSMYDLGNKKTDGVPYSSYFRSLGIVYDAIDLNGMDGALPLDLNAEIKLAPRELVSNLGTSEHVLNQEACFRNVHNLAARRMVHWVPLEKRHPRHGLYGYSVDFFIDLAEANDYEIDRLYIETSFKSWKLVCGSFTKRSQRDFVWREDWFLTANPSGEWGVATNH